MNEYKVAVTRDVASDETALTNWLNRQSLDGWTLVAVNQGIMYLTRPFAAPLRRKTTT